MTAEIVFNLLLGLGIILYLLKAQQLPQSDNTNDVLGAGGFPVILGILVAVATTPGKRRNQRFICCS